MESRQWLIPLLISMIFKFRLQLREKEIELVEEGSANSSVSNFYSCSAADIETGGRREGKTCINRSRSHAKVDSFLLLSTILAQREATDSLSKLDRALSVELHEKSVQHILDLCSQHKRTQFSRSPYCRRSHFWRRSHRSKENIWQSDIFEGLTLTNNDRCVGCVGPIVRLLTIRTEVEENQIYFTFLLFRTYMLLLFERHPAEVDRGSFTLDGSLGLARVKIDNHEIRSRVGEHQRIVFASQTDQNLKEEEDRMKRKRKRGTIETQRRRGSRLSEKNSFRKVKYKEGLIWEGRK